MKSSPDTATEIIDMAGKLIDADPNKTAPIENRVAAMRVAIAALEAEQGRQMQVAMVAKMLR